MSLFSRLFGKTPEAEIEPESYEGYRIFPEPIREGNTWRIAARIEKDVAGVIKTHNLVRADTIEDQSAASEASVRKAKQVIDEQGDGIFRS